MKQILDKDQHSRGHECIKEMNGRSWFGLDDNLGKSEAVKNLERCDWGQTILWRETLFIPAKQEPPELARDGQGRGHKL